jgi:thiamine-monophosphate kinase
MSTRGEFDLIAWIRNRLPQESDLVSCGIGDDGAVFSVPAGAEAVVTTDMLVEGIDFRREWAPPWFLGRKSLAVCLSDLAAMGAAPLACLLSLALPSQLTGAYFERFIDGFLEGGARWQSPLIGGDLSRSPVVSVTVTAIGTVPAGTAILRSGAAPGDLIIVFGNLGLSRLGLETLERERPDFPVEMSSALDLERWSRTSQRYAALRAQLLPEPLLTSGRWLREKRLASAMIDISDGLAADLKHVVEASRVAAEVDLQKTRENRVGLPLDEQTVLNGGEDYALIATVHADRFDELARGYASTLPAWRVIGRIIPGPPAIYIVDGDSRRECHPEGFEHFQ